MSRNKGKDGELRFVRLSCDIGVAEDTWDVTRPTTTNESDLGGDMFIRSSAAAMSRTITSVVTVPEYGGSGALRALGEKIIQTRVDSKNESGKLQKDVIDKFVGDIAKNPMATAHLLAGGSALTGPAHKAFVHYSEKLREDGKVLLYLSNPDITRLEDNFSESRPKASSAGLPGPAPSQEPPVLPD